MDKNLPVCFAVRSPIWATEELEQMLHDFLNFLHSATEGFYKTVETSENNMEC